MDKSKKILLISLIPAFLTLMFVLNILVPAFGDMNSANEKLKNQKRELAELNQQIEDARKDQALVKEVVGLKNQLREFDTNVPSEAETAILLIDMEKFAAKNKMKVIGLSAKPQAEIEIQKPGEDKTKKKSKRKKKQEAVKPVQLFEIPVEIELVGYYTDAVRFVNDLEKYQRIVSISGVTLKDYEKDDKKSLPRVKIIVDSKIYRFVQNDVEIAPETPETPEEENVKKSAKKDNA